MVILRQHCKYPWAQAALFVVTVELVVIWSMQDTIASSPPEEALMKFILSLFLQLG